MSKKQELDQYFTNPIVGEWMKNVVVSSVDTDGKVFLEPSAGDRAISMPFIKSGFDVIEADLDPKHCEIIRQDFLASNAEQFGIVKSSDAIVIGNPPFGWASSLAVKFFNKAATMADVVAFIIPKTFRKESVKNKLDLSFELIVDLDLPMKNAFLLDGEEYFVPCCLQVWRKIEGGKLREKVVAPENVWFEFGDKETATFSIRRVGGRAGQVLEGTAYNSNTTYFINPMIDCEQLKTALKQIDFSEIVSNTAGVRSVSQDEIVIELAKVMGGNV